MMHFYYIVLFFRIVTGGSMWTTKKMNSSKTATHFDMFRDQCIIFECPDPIGEIVYAK